MAGPQSADKPPDRDRPVRLRHWLLVLAVRGMGGIAGVLATVATTRLLGAEQAGLIALSLAIVTVLAALSRIGLDNTVVRFVGMHAAQGEWNYVQGVHRLALNWAARASIAVGALLCLASWPLANFVFDKPGLAAVLAIMAWLVPSRAVYFLCAQGFVGVRRPELASFLHNICMPVAFVFLLLAAMSLGLPASSTILAATSYSLAALVTLVLGMLAWRKLVPHAAPTFDQNALWSSAAPLWIVVVMSQVATWGAQIVSGVWLNSAEVAQLAAAQRTALLVNLVLMVTNLLVAPRFAALYRQEKTGDLKLLARKTTRMMTFVATAVVLWVALFAAPMMGVFGEEFVPAAALLQILICGQWINVATGSVQQLLQMTGHERDMRNIMLVTGSLSIVLAVVLTIRFGVYGTAWAITLSLIVQNLAALAMVKRRLGFLTLL
jgi:O-antigen/teichoic acid export membrane protein